MCSVYGLLVHMVPPSPGVIAGFPPTNHPVLPLFWQSYVPVHHACDMHYRDILHKKENINIKQKQLYQVPTLIRNSMQGKSPSQCSDEDRESNVAADWMVSLRGDRSEIMSKHKQRGVLLPHHQSSASDLLEFSISSPNRSALSAGKNSISRNVSNAGSSQRGMSDLMQDSVSNFSGIPDLMPDSATIYSDPDTASVLSFAAGAPAPSSPLARSSQPPNSGRRGSLQPAVASSLSAGVSKPLPPSSFRIEENIWPPTVGSSRADGADCPWLWVMDHVNHCAIFLRESKSFEVDSLTGKDVLFGSFSCQLALRRSSTSFTSIATSLPELKPRLSVSSEAETRSAMEDEVYQESFSVDSSSDALGMEAGDDMTDDVETGAGNAGQFVWRECRVEWLYRVPFYYSLVMAPTQVNMPLARMHLRRIDDRLQAIFKVHDQPGEFRYRADKIHWLLSHILRADNLHPLNPRAEIATDKEMEYMKNFLKL